MVPFMYYDIKNICNILESIVIPEVLVKVYKPHKLKDIDFSNRNNLIKPEEMSIGFAVDCKVKKFKKRDVVNSANIKALKKSAHKCLVAVEEKLLERASLATSPFDFFYDLQDMLQMLNENAVDLFKSLLTLHKK